MTASRRVLVVDVGTSSVRAAIMGADGSLGAGHERELLPDSPADGLVESEDQKGFCVAPVSTKDLLVEACTRRRGFGTLSRDEMRLAGYPDCTPEIDVCAGIE